MAFPRALLSTLILGVVQTLAGAAATGVDASALRLTAEIGGQVHDHFAVEHGQIVTRDGGVSRPVPANATWKLEGDLRRDESLPGFSPWYRIMQQAPLAVSEEPRYSAVIRIERNWPWSIGDFNNAIVVLAWLVDGKPVLVAPVVPNLEVKSSKREAAVYAFDLRPDNARGQAIALLLGPHGFISSMPRLLDRATQKVLTDMYLRSPEEALKSARELTVIDRHATNGVTLLHCAAAGGWVQMVEYLLSRGGNPDLDSKQSTPLHLAAANGRREVVQAILAARSAGSPGSNPPPVEAALGFGHLDVAMTMLNNAAGGTDADKIATLAVQQGRADILADLLTRQADVNLASLPPPTIAQVLSRQDHKMFDLLLAKGVKADGSVQGTPWLVLAAYAGDPLAVAALLHAGAPVDAADPQGVTSLMVASQSAPAEVVRALLDVGADSNRRDNNGATALHLATSAGRVDSLAQLLAHGARVDIRDNLGRSALDLALETQSRPAVAALVAAGASLDPKSPAIGEMIVRAIRLDQADLLRGAATAGWKPELPVFESLTATDIAGACEAKSTAAWLGTLSLPAPEHGWLVERKPDSVARPTKGGRPADPRPRDKDQPAVSVTVSGVVDASGRFLFPRLGPCPDARLAEAVLAAVPTWKFEPAARNGAAVNAFMTLSAAFNANEAKIYDSSDIEVPPAVNGTALLRSKETVDVAYASANGFISGNARNNLLHTNLAIAKVPPAFGIGSMVYTIQADYGNWTVLAFVVEPDGKASNISVVSSKNHDFAQSAVDALETYRFAPGLHAGHPVRTHMTLTLQPDN